MVIKKLKDHGINTMNRTYIIAEIGINHRGCLKTAKELIDSAVSAGVDAVKFQTYLTEKRIPDPNNNLFKILKDLELPFDYFQELKEYTSQYSIDFFSTPFDIESLNYLEGINVDLYKIASFDVVNHKLLEDISKTGKTIILSVGMSQLNEIHAAHKILSKGCKNIALLHCISSYPTAERDSRLSNLYRLQNDFDCIIGQSDHTNDIFVPLCAVAAGAQIIEKHYKISENFECVDAPVSITENQMRKLVKETRRIETIFGDEEFGIRKIEEETQVFRRKSSNL